MTIQWELQSQGYRLNRVLWVSMRERRLELNRPRFQLRRRQHQVREEDEPPGEDCEEDHVRPSKKVIRYHSRFQRT